MELPLWLRKQETSEGTKGDLDARTKGKQTPYLFKCPLHTWSIGMCLFEINLYGCYTFNAVNKVMCLLIGFTAVFFKWPLLDFHLGKQ